MLDGLIVPDEFKDCTEFQLYTLEWFLQLDTPPNANPFTAYTGCLCHSINMGEVTIQPTRQRLPYFKRPSSHLTTVIPTYFQISSHPLSQP